VVLKIRSDQFFKEARANHPELESAVQQFLLGSHSPEIQAIKQRLRSFLLWDKALQQQIQNLFKQLSVQAVLSDA
jgi:hypothetical protein